MNLTSSIGLSPLGAYHALMYGKSIYFDIKDAQRALNFKPVYSNNKMFESTYDWYCDRREDIVSGKLWVLNINQR